MNTPNHSFISTHLPEAGLERLGYEVSYVKPELHDFKLEQAPYVKSDGKRSRKYDKGVASSARLNWSDDSHLYPRKSDGVAGYAAWQVSHAKTGACIGHILIPHAPTGAFWGSADFVFEPVIKKGAEMEGVHPWFAGSHQAGGPCDLKTAHFFTSFMDDFMESWGNLHGYPEFAEINKVRTAARIEAEQKIRFRQRKGIAKQIAEFFRLIEA